MATMTIYASSVSGTGWTNASNASGESDSSYATVTLARNTTRTLTATFTNSLPTGATINSITAYCRLYRSNTTTLSTSTLNATTVTVPTSIGNVSASVGTTFPSSVSLSIRTSQRNNLPTIYVDSFWLEVDYTEYVPTIESASVSPSSVTLESKGATQQLTGSYSPSDLTGVTTSWTSENNSVATVSSSGLVTAVANGTANITYSATYEGITKTATCSVTVNIPRLFPYEASIELGTLTESSTTIDGVTLTTTTSDESLIYYKIPCQYGYSATIEFDYVTDIASIYFGVVDRIPSPDVNLTEPLNLRDTTSGHVKLQFNNNHGGEVDYVEFFYEVWRTGTTTISNFTVTTYERLFPYEIVLISRMEEIATTETGATLITTEQDQQADVYYKLPLEIGKSYKISFDYETNCGSFYISVRNRTLSPNYYLLEEQNIRDTLSGHLEYTFSNDYESAMDYASFGIKTFRSDVTFTFSNFTLEEYHTPRLFPYEYIPFSGTMYEQDTTIDSTTLVTESEEQSISYYKIPCQYGKSYKISFDYTSSVGSFYLKVSDNVDGRYIPITDDTNPRDTSGSISITFTNNGESQSDYVYFHYETWHQGEVTLSNFTVTEIIESGTNLIRLGSTKPTAFYLGDLPVQRIYLGINLVYEVPLI